MSGDETYVTNPLVEDNHSRYKSGSEEQAEIEEALARLSKVHQDHVPKATPVKKSIHHYTSQKPRPG